MSTLHGSVKGYIHPHYTKLTIVVNKSLQSVRYAISFFNRLIRKQIRKIKEFICHQIGFIKLCRVYVIARDKSTVIINQYLRIAKEQLDRFPEPEWVAKIRKTYNENERIVRLRNISKREVVSSKQYNARVIIWSVLFVLVAYSGFHKVLEFTYKSDISTY